ncbi:hypothetical protein KY334_03655 [Candidatus Woesearchaeota archaeon]|nr:hypothetical protein [Candidatus Woesearchaeota archaeon]
MSWNKKEIFSKFETKDLKYDMDFDNINGEWRRTKREEIHIDCDELRNKKKLSEHEEFELKMCEALF